jgi:RNA polymerase sigma-70 factor (ECF subfamily)
MLGTLPAPYAEALRAADLEGRSQLDLARSLGLSHSAVKSRVQRARAMLRENLIACCGSSDGDLDCGTCGDDA